MHIPEPPPPTTYPGRWYISIYAERENKLASPQRPPHSLSWRYRRGGSGAGATSKHRWSGAVRNGFSGKTITLGPLVTRASRNPVSLMLIELRIGRGGRGRGIKTESNCGAAPPTALPARICSRQFDLSGLIADEKPRTSGEPENEIFTRHFICSRSHYEHILIRPRWL